MYGPNVPPPTWFWPFTNFILLIICVPLLFVEAVPPEVGLVFSAMFYSTSVAYLVIVMAWLFNSSKNPIGYIILSLFIFSTANACINIAVDRLDPASYQFRDASTPFERRFDNFITTIKLPTRFVDQSVVSVSAIAKLLEFVHANVSFYLSITFAVGGVSYFARRKS